ncbi:type II toxin-antitoxin system RelE/ParE family toxin [Flavobacterium sp. SUN052]|uniref:type II toxin-antitoxin system RelE/ParE family toxin n=1 Tax=Flavobacterium sp. SUN052 TaxID=3002441 RepID=UPI00237DFDF3|nr:type II toxin-antitoxin system RelE/ParE family toxin [Flavobacterium sp. SUN052]MEC4004623.1 type II toxin-antitoxin system RelE/ParE family toxin [Flavobacterium sp. SUN052]
MKIVLTPFFILDLDNQVRYISKDKPQAAKKFKKDLIRNLKKDLKNPFHFKKSNYFDDELIRDYVFKGYTTVYNINEISNIIEVFGFIKYKETL